jgi:hypothetical protein
VTFLLQAQLAKAQEEEADRLRQIVLARQLATQAELIRDKWAHLLERSVLLAVEAMQRPNSMGTRSAEADQALRQGLALLPRLVARMAHSGGVIAFSPDGKYLPRQVSAPHV